MTDYLLGSQTGLPLLIDDGLPTEHSSRVTNRLTLDDGLPSIRPPAQLHANCENVALQVIASASLASQVSDRSSNNPEHIAGLIIIRDNHPISGMDYSSLVAAQPSAANFVKSSSRLRWAAIVCASALLVSCAILVSTLGATQQPSITVDLGLSPSELKGPADAEPVRFTTLKSDPIDSVLKKARTRLNCH